MMIDNLKMRKAPGWDKVTNAHIKFGGANLQKCIILLSNAINKLEYIPNNFKLGLIVPIPKGQKNRLHQDNHRGISLLPVFSKIYEKVLYNRTLAWARKNNLLHHLQGAEREKCSSLNTAWLIKEAITSNLENGKSVYVGMLDKRKAYDSLWLKGNFYKLYTLGMKGRAWRKLPQPYSDFKCKVCFAGRCSEPLEP